LERRRENRVRERAINVDADEESEEMDDNFGPSGGILGTEKEAPPIASPESTDGSTE
jgi:hypothetical protein